MDSLPPELLHQILLQLPPSCRKSARLASRRFSAVLARNAFSLLPSFMDPDTALATLEATVADLKTRSRSIWSPRCSVPDQLPLAQSFLLAMHVALVGHSWSPPPPARRLESDEECSGSDDDDDDAGVAVLSAQSLSSRLGRRDVTEEALRRAMFRYALYLSYLYDGEGEAPQLWVLKTDRWAAKA